MIRTYGDVSKEWLDKFIGSPEFPGWLERAQRNYDLSVAKLQMDMDRSIAEDIRQAAERESGR